MFPEALDAARLTAHLRVLCGDIGARPGTSAAERRAAGYVQATLRGLGLRDVSEQRFASQDSLGWVVIPPALAAALAPALAGLGGRWGKLAAGLLTVAGVFSVYGFTRARPPVFQRLIARGTSQNVIAHIAPRGALRREVVLVAHLDTQKQRHSMPPARQELMPAMGSAMLLAPLVLGLSFLVDWARNRRGLRLWQRLLSAGNWGSLAMLVRDELQPHVEGANDNASSVGVLLGIAAALQAAPLEHTAVTLLFTGCEEVICVGMEAYLDAYAPPVQDTHWIDLEMVGTGDVCYVTRHGMAPTVHYEPGAHMLEYAARAAHRYPELRVTGKPMLILEEVANLRHRGYDALCIAGYDARGFLPNWHRLSDTLANIQAGTLERAARFTWGLLQVLDD